MEQIKAELKSLTSRKEAIETEIAEHSQRLNAPGQPGMDGPLIDDEGYPRADIDVLAVRKDRNAVICLANDHKQVTRQLEQLLHQLHAQARQSGAVNGPAPAAAAASAEAGAATGPRAAGPAAPPAGTPSAGSGCGQPALRPFAVVDEVADGSPAHEAGIQLGDQLCRFGAAVAGAGGGSELQEVAQQLQQHEGRAVEVTFLRQGQQVVLTLVPRKWQGRGLLGCHLRPL